MAPSRPAPVSSTWLLAALVAVLAMTGGSLADSVHELSDANFDSELEAMDAALVMFYAPWCGHCKRLKPEFEKAASVLSSNDPPVNLVKVDCTEAGKDTCGRFDVRGYPTLKIFRNGEVSQDYNGPREAAGITKYMAAQVGPASKELKTLKDLQSIREKAEVVVVSFHTDKDKDAAFQKTASALRETVFFAHFSSLPSDAPEKDTVVLYRPKHLHTKLEPDQEKFTGEVKKDKLTSWIKENYHGLVGHRTLDNAGDFKEPLVIAFYGVDYVKNVKGTNYWRNRVLKVAKEHKDELNFAVSSKDDFMQEATEFGLSSMAEDKPRIVIKANGKKFVMEQEFSMDAFKDFLSSYNQGKIDPYLKSEPVPESNDGPVKVAVAKNFDELVTDSGKDALVEFYAPWCGHCKKLTPIYDELGEKLSAEDGVTIVKMDATANDVPAEYDVRGFPTIYWVPSSGKPEAYNGGRDLDDFVQFIAKKSTKELDGFDRKGKAKKVEL